MSRTRQLLRRVRGYFQAYTNAFLLCLYGFDLSKARFPNAFFNTVIYIDPRKVRFRCGLLSKEKMTDNFFWGGDWDLSLETMECCEKEDYRYTSCRQMMGEGVPFDRTDEYLYYSKKLASGLKARGYRTIEKVKEYMQSLQVLYDRIIVDGEIKSQAKLGGNPFDGEINFVVGRTGELLKSDEGNHRFAIALFCEFRCIPIQVSLIHSDLLDEIRKEMGGGKNSVRVVNEFLLRLQARYS